MPNKRNLSLSFAKFRSMQKTFEMKKLFCHHRNDYVYAQQSTDEIFECGSELYIYVLE
jgi:hypothetical protein